MGTAMNGSSAIERSEGAAQTTARSPLPRGWLRRLVLKPWAGANPLPRVELLLYALIALVSLGGTVYAAVELSPPLMTEPLLLGVIVALAASITLPFGPSQLVSDSSDLFLAIAIVGLGMSGGGAWVALSATVIIAVTRGGDWQRVILFAAFFGAMGASAVATVEAIDLAVAAAWWVPIVQTYAVFVAWFVVGIVFHVIDVFCIPERTHRVAGLMAAVRREHGDSIEESLRSLLSTPPMAALSVIAYQLSPATLFLVAAPYIAGWNAMHLAARLASAEHRSGIDSLTGLANRERLYERATTELEMARAYGHSVTIVMGDLDNFKRVNDTLGHLTGDEVLRATATILRRRVDERVYLAARYGGEEFLLLLPTATVESAFDLVEAIRVEVEQEIGQYGTSVSWGLTRMLPDDDLEQMIARADKALYASKIAGKNCTTIWPEHPADTQMVDGLAA
jgi:diguanylate cyclase (GGDEF)-like protein